MTSSHQKKILKQFGNKLRELRIQKGLTQEDVSIMSGISFNQIGRIERGEINTGILTVYLLADVLKLPVTKFFDNNL